MIINIILDTPTANILKYYGGVSYAVNKILEHGALGEIPLMDLPMVPIPSQNTKQYKVNVTNEHYLELCQLYGVKSSRISLRRIIYWFIDNEKYVDFAWESNGAFDGHTDKSVISILNDIEEKVYQLRKHLKDNPQLLKIKTEIDILKQEVWDA